MDWEQARQSMASKERPEDWPPGVYAIGGGLAFLGIHEKTEKLYWDGKEIVTRSIIRLRGYELMLATIATTATVGMFIVSLGDAVGWW